MIRKVTEYSLKVGWCYHRLNRVQRAKGLRNSMANFSPRINITCATSRNLPAVENIQRFLACNNGSRYVLESKTDLEPVLKEFDME